MIPNLWPDFDTTKGPRPPKAIIEEAGRGLESRTNGVIRFYTAGTRVVDNKVDMQFTLYAVALSYHYPFMRAQFGVHPYYPVTVTPDKLDPVTAQNEEELLMSLKAIFTSTSTVNTVEQLLALSEP